MTENDSKDIVRKAVKEAVAQADAHYPPTQLSQGRRIMIAVVAFLAVVGTAGSTVDFIRLQGIVTCQQMVTQEGRKIATDDRTVVDETVLKLLTGTRVSRAQVLKVRTNYIALRKRNDAARADAYSNTCGS